MRRFGCLRLIGRMIVLVVGAALIVALSMAAVNGVRELTRRAERQQVEAEQSTAFPGTATALAFLNTPVSAAVTAQSTGNPTQNPDETATATPTETAAATLPSTENPTETATRPLTETATATPTETASATPTTTATATPTQESTATASLTATATATFTATSTPTLTETYTATVRPTETPTATEALISIVTLTPTQTTTPDSAAVALQSPLPTNTKRPSNTPPPTNTAVSMATSAAIIMPTNTVAVTAPPPTVAPIRTATAVAVLPTLGATSTLPRVLGRNDCTDKPQPTAVPTRAPRLKSPDDIMNIALIGSDADVDPTDPSFRTDTLLIVSINRTTNTVSLLSIPRDLYVCIPQLGMNRINVAFQWGESVGWTPGGGFGLLQETVLYNLGIPLHFYARVSFTGFKAIIDTLNGVNVAVDCPMVNELRFQGKYNDLKTPQYEPFTLPVGYYHMDGSLALWYARVRTSTSDFDRNRRQQQILRAIWREARDQGLIQKAPELWAQAQNVIKTNMQLNDILGLAPLALNLQPEDITSYYMFKGIELQHFRTPAGDDVQIPDPAGFFRTINAFYTPPTRNRLAREVGTIEVVNGTGNENWDKVAADTLGWLGFNATAKGKGDPTVKSVLYDYTGSASPTVMMAMLKALNMRSDQVISQPDPNRTADFRVVLGDNYVSCSAPGFAK